MPSEFIDSLRILYYIYPPREGARPPGRAYDASELTNLSMAEKALSADFSFRSRNSFV